MNDLLLFFILIKSIFFIILYLTSGVEFASVPFKENKYLNNNECNNNGIYNYFWKLTKNGKDVNISYIFGILKFITIDEINNSLPKELWKELNNSDIILLEANYNAKKKDWIECFNKLKGEHNITKKIEERLQNYYNNYQRFGLLKYFNWKDLPSQWIFQGIINLRAELEKRIKNINEQSLLFTKEIEQKGIQNSKKIFYLNNLTDNFCNNFPLLANNQKLMEFALDKLLNEIEEIIKKQKIIGSWQRAINKYKCGNFQITDDLIGEENILKEYFDQVDLDNFRKTINLLNKDLNIHREIIAKKIIKNMEKNPEKKLFFFVDAGHLVGENNLINILAEKGYILKQYNPSKEITKKEYLTTINYLNNNNKVTSINSENRNIREEKNIKKEEENETFFELKINKTNNNKLKIINNINLTTTTTTTTINNNNIIILENNKTTKVFNNNKTIIINNNNSNKKYSSFWTALIIFIISNLLIIIFVCWIIFNNNCFTSNRFKPPNISGICSNDENNGYKITAVNYKLNDDNLKIKEKQQIWITSSPSSQKINNNNIFSLNNTTPPKSSNKSFSESTETIETSFNEENKNNDKIEIANNKNEFLTKQLLEEEEEGEQQQQYLSTSSLTFSSQIPKTQLNQTNKIKNISSEKHPNYNKSLQTIKESKREAPPPPIPSNIPSFNNNNIKNKKDNNLENDSSDNNLYAKINKQKNEEIITPKEEEEKEINKNNNLILNEYNGINYSLNNEYQQLNEDNNQNNNSSLISSTEEKNISDEKLNENNNKIE